MSNVFHFDVSHFSNNGSESIAKKAAVNKEDKSYFGSSSSDERKQSNNKFNIAKISITIQNAEPNKQDKSISSISNIENEGKFLTVNKKEHRRRSKSTDIHLDFDKQNKLSENKVDDSLRADSYNDVPFLNLPQKVLLTL